MVLTLRKRCVDIHPVLAPFSSRPFGGTDSNSVPRLICEQPVEFGLVHRPLSDSALRWLADPLVHLISLSIEEFGL